MPAIRVVSLRQFDGWLEKLKDVQARKIIARRMNRLAEGHFGMTRNLGGGVSELKIDFGPGYRLYYTQRSATVVWLLCGGDKSTQDADIALARKQGATIAGGDDGH